MGKDLSDIAPDELGCANALSRVIQKVFPDFPTFISTIALKSHLAGDERFVYSDVQPWSIIVSPTMKGEVGHVGILGDGGIIYSNNSATGRFDDHWNLDTWINYYRVQKKLRIYFYKLI
ncbi:MAG: hypothetical protein U1C12_01655 [Patescibacteria group bacterium]|nr:hypothetical protein [Patescibacteria group bacterium]